MEQENRQSEKLQLMLRYYVALVSESKLKARLADDIAIARTKATKSNNGALRDDFSLSSPNLTLLTVLILGSSHPSSHEPFTTCLLVISIMRPGRIRVLGRYKARRHMTTRALKEVELEARLLRLHKIKFRSQCTGVTLSADDLQPLIDRHEQAKGDSPQLPDARSDRFDCHDECQAKGDSVGTVNATFLSVKSIR